MSSEGKVAVITGAGSGIGRASALALYREGYSVTLAGRREEPLNETIQLSGDDGSKTLAVSTDVGDPAAVKNLFGKIKDKFGRLDLLFNNAGSGAPPVPMEELTYDQWKAVVDVNLTGSFLCTQQAIIMMKAQNPQGGRIINNGSLSAYVPRPRSVAYTATKHAITGLTKTTSLDGREFDIVCSQIDIGNAETPMTARMHDGVLQPDGSTMAEPTYDVEHAARAIVFIATLPLDTNVQFINVMATKMPFIGRG